MNHPLRDLSILAVAALCAVVSPLGAEPAPASQDPPGPSTQSEGPVDVVEARRDLWLAESKLTLGTAEDGSWIGSGVVEIAVPPGPAWGRARISAFRRAEAEARASFIELNGVEVTIETFSHLFADRPDWLAALDAGAPTRGDRLARIEEKLASLDEADLARALELAGVTAEELAALSAGEQRKVLEETFRTRIVTRAVARMAGLRVIQTFEGNVGDRHAVCVLVRWSDENARLAEVLRLGQGTIAPAAAGRPVEAWIPGDDSLLIHQWGVRVFPGPEGEPLILVFSQSPIVVGPRDDGRVLEAKRHAALSIARTSARGSLTLFVDCVTASEQWLDQGDGLEQSLTLFPGGLAELSPGSGALTQTLTHTIEERGAAVIDGGSIVRSWTTNHPDTGTPFCGVVLAWSPTRARLALGQGSGGTKGSTGKPAGSGDDRPVDF